MHCNNCYNSKRSSTPSCAFSSVSLISRITWAFERSLGVIAHSINTAVVFSCDTLIDIWKKFQSLDSESDLESIESCWFSPLWQNGWNIFSPNNNRKVSSLYSRPSPCYPEFSFQNRRYFFAFFFFFADDAGTSYAPLSSSMNLAAR